MSASAPPLADRSVRVFASFLIARAAFGLVYLAAAVRHPPIPWYYPFTHAWEITSAPRSHAMGWFGLTALALTAAALAGGLMYLISGAPGVARVLARPEVVLGIARAGGLILLVDFVYFGWALSHDDRKPWTPPDCSPARAHPAPRATPLLHVPRTAQAMKLDGELNEPVWNNLAARTGAFEDAAGAEARPYSEGRFLWDGEDLLVALYAADDDIEAKATQHDAPVSTDDAFVLRITPVTPAAPTYSFDIAATGFFADARRVPGAPDADADLRWESGMRLGVDRDGTVNDPRDVDEEWVVEASIPLASMGVTAAEGTQLLVEISRCDTPRGTHERRCGTWGDPSRRRLLQLGR